MAGPIRISILADDKASRAFASVGANAGGLGVRVGKAGKALGVAMLAGTAIAGAAALKFGADSVKAASDAQQSLGATETVFGRYAKTVIKRSNEADTAVGISANEYRELSNVVGASLTGAGISIQKATVLTGDLNKRAADMAATFGGTTREAVEAVSSALRGETDPIERYGVSIKATDVNARLAAQGQDKLTGAALKSAEMQARLDLIFSKTAATQGAFARESDTLAHQQQVLGAQWENLKAKVGSALLPVLTQLLTVLNANLMPAFAAVSAAVAPVVARIKEFFDGAGQGQGILAALSAFLTGQVVPALAAVVAAYQGLAAVVLPILAQVAAAVISGWSQIQPQVQAIWGSVQNIILSALSIIRSVVQIGTAAIAAIWNKFGGTILAFITSTMKNVATVLKGAFQIIEGLFKTVSALLRGDWSGAWDGIKTIAEGALNVIKGAVSQAWNMIRAATSVAWTAIKVLVSAAWDGLVDAVKAGVRKAVDFVRGLPGKITSAIGDLGSLLLDAGRSLIQGLIDGIGDKVGDLTGKLGSITDMIPKWKGPADKDRRLLRPVGRMIIDGLIRGFEDGEDGVRRSLERITDLIKKRVDLKDNKAEAARERSLIASLRDQYTALVKNGRAQDKVNDALDRARDRLKDIRQEARGYAQAVRDAVLASANITKVGVRDDGLQTWGTIMAGLGAKLRETQAFSAALEKLKGLGVNDTIYDQIVQAAQQDMSAAMSTAQALIDGGASSVAAINKVQEQLDDAATALGKQTSTTLYSAGISAAEAVVAGLERRAQRLDGIADRLADRLITRLESLLGKQPVGQVKQQLNRKAQQTTAARAEVTTNDRARRDAPTVVQIHVTAPVGASSADIGRELQKHLTAFLASGGRQVAVG